MIICQKAKMAIPAARERERSAIKMALFNRKHTKPQYVFQPGTRVAVHTLGITFIFEGDNVRLLVEKFDRPKMWRSDDALLPSGKRSLALNVSTRDGAELYFDNAAAYPNGGDFNQTETRAYDIWELIPCSYAQFRYKSLKLVYKEGRISIWVDELNSSCVVLPVVTSKNGKSSYEFFVATHNVDATVSDIISERFFRVRIPGATHAILEKTKSSKDRDGSTTLEMRLIVEGKSKGSISVKEKSSKKKVVPQLLAKVLPGTPLDLS